MTQTLTAEAPVEREPERGDAAPGRLRRVSGPVVDAEGLHGARLFDLVRIGDARIPGEVIRLDGDIATIQAFEDTSGLRAGDPVEQTGAPLLAELGPGLLGSIVDGIGRPLTVIAGSGEGGPVRPFIDRGVDPPRLDRTAVWDFRPTVSVGDEVGPGDVLGTVAETEHLAHRVLVPPRHAPGRVSAVRAGAASVDDAVVEIDGRPVTMLQRWPIRQARPVGRVLGPDEPLITNLRVLDVLFPVAKGGAAIIPGGFGTGKTVTEQALAKHCAADVIVYIGCGERGNELTEVLQEFPELQDPRTGGPLMERTVLVANTSNMPVAARESSIYLGMTIAEYFRDQGYDVALMADSTSRWGEALREVSARLEEIPAEDGYPAYLASRLAGFYERAGRVECLGDEASRTGSVTAIGAVSPAGGDFSEPITQNSLRLAGCFWGLDTQLARRRHFPAVNWSRSFSQYRLDDWFATQVDADWLELRVWAAGLLQQESALQDVVQLLGEEALAPAQLVVLRTGRALREDFLQQNSFDPADAASPPRKAIAMLRVIRSVHEAMSARVDAGVEPSRVVTVAGLTRLARMKRWTAEEASASAPALLAEITAELEELQ